MRLAVTLAAMVFVVGMASNESLAQERGGVDPLGSARWKDMEKIFLADGPFEFDERVKVLSSSLAENPLQVPITVDATALTDVREVVVFADFNPILEIIRFYPDATNAYLGFRAKLQQSSPVRAAAKTADGVWHVGGTWVNTAGGGCTAPSAGSASPAWQKRLNEVSARTWSEGALAGRVRLRIVHPMDTGLVAGIPAFHLEEVVLKETSGKSLMRLQLSQPVSENPVFTLNRGAQKEALAVSGHDNNGNTFDVRIAP